MISLVFLLLFVFMVVGFVLQNHIISLVDSRLNVSKHHLLFFLLDAYHSRKKKQNYFFYPYNYFSEYFLYFCRNITQA